MKTGLRKKFIIIVLLAVLPFLVYALLEYVQTLAENKQEVIERNQDKAAELATDIDDFIDSSESVLYSLSLHPALGKQDSTAANEIFSQLLPLFPLHLNILAADMQGNNFASAVNPETAKKSNYLARDWFIRGSNGVSAVSDIHHSKLFQHPAFMITIPVFAPSGEQISILGFPVNLYRLQEHFLTTESLGTRTDLAVFDNKSVFLINTADAGEIGKPCKQLGLIREMAGKPSGSLVSVDTKGVKRFYSFATVKRTGWKVLVGVPSSVVYAEANRGALRHFFFFLTICLSGSLAAFYYSRRLANRIGVLISGLDEIAGGNFDCRLPNRGSDELSKACDAFNRMTEERQKAEEEILSLTSALEKRVEIRTAELTSAKNELESFSYAVSHDLQTPVRHMIAYSQILMDEFPSDISDTAMPYVQRINRSGLQMRDLITHLLALSRLNTQDINRTVVDLSMLCRSICTEMEESFPDHRVEVVIEEGLTVAADPSLLKIALQNLIGNAWKYTKNAATPRVEIGSTEQNGEDCFYIRDNGTGFNPAYKDKLFVPFQRLHSAEQFEGSGLGLATVMRIIQRHGGTIWAESSPDNGAVFYFTLSRES